MTVADDLATLRGWANSYGRIYADSTHVRFPHRALDRVEAEIARLEREREGYKLDFLAALERSEMQETRLRVLQEAVSEYLVYPTLAGRRERLELILADLNPDGGSKGFSGGA